MRCYVVSDDSGAHILFLEPPHYCQNYTFRPELEFVILEYEPFKCAASSPSAAYPPHPSVDGPSTDAPDDRKTRTKPQHLLNSLWAFTPFSSQKKWIVPFNLKLVTLLFFTFNWILNWKVTQLAFYLQSVIQLFSSGSSPEDLPGSFLIDTWDPYRKQV